MLTYLGTVLGFEITVEGKNQNYDLYRGYFTLEKQKY